MASRAEQPFDEGLFYQPPLELGKNIKASFCVYSCSSNHQADWMLQAKAICQWIRTASQHVGEIEVKADYFEVLPRKGMIVLHQEDNQVSLIIEEECYARRCS